MRFHRRAIYVAAAVAAILAATVTPAFATHFRASNSGLSYANGVLTWSVDSAWRKDDVDDMLYSASDVDITEGGSPVNTVSVGTPTSNYDQSNPLYAVTHNSVAMDISGTLNSPGTYQAYVTSCCRVGGVANTNSNNSFSQAVSWTVNADQTVNMPPVFNHPELYAMIPVSSGGTHLTVDYTATDPEGGAVSYSQMTNTNSPDWGATALPCSSFSGGILTLDPALCTGGDVFNTIYTSGTFFAVKVRATDAAGDHSEVDTLLRVPTQPQPYVDTITTDKGTASVAIGLNDWDTVVDTYDVTCTNTGDSSDVLTGSGVTSPVTVAGMQPNTTYSCGVTATNGIGTGTGTPQTVTTGNFATQAITFPAPADVALAAGTTSVSATATSGLTVTFSSTTPAVCTVSGTTVTLVSAGTCTIAADQAGDSTYTAAPQVTRSFLVKPAVPNPGTVSTTGGSGQNQQTVVTVPSGGSVTLLDAHGNPATVVTVAHQGTYTLDPATGIITFAPAAGFHGHATAVAYRVTDAFGQSAASTYTATVTGATVTAGKAAVSAPSWVTNGRTVPATCSISTGKLTACSVTAYATVGGKRVVVGTGRRTLHGAAADHAGTSLKIAVVLNAEGRRLAARAAGVKVGLVAEVTQTGISGHHYAKTTSTVVAPAVTLRPIYFGFDSATVSKADAVYLASLSGKLAHTTSVVCAGYTDYAGANPHEKQLGQQRAHNVCALLKGGKHGAMSTVSYAGSRPVQTSGDPVSRKQNRRVVVTLKY